MCAWPARESEPLQPLPLAAPSAHPHPRFETSWRTREVNGTKCDHLAFFLFAEYLKVFRSLKINLFQLEGQRATVSITTTPQKIGFGKYKRINCIVFMLNHVPLDTYEKRQTLVHPASLAPVSLTNERPLSNSQRPVKKSTCEPIHDAAEQADRLRWKRNKTENCRCNFHHCNLHKVGEVTLGKILGALKQWSG